MVYTLNMKPRLYLQVGNLVEHIAHPLWGTGEVVEERHSTLAGGFCLVRILFEDGIERSFVNDLENQGCCYYFGIKLI